MAGREAEGSRGGGQVSSRAGGPVGVEEIERAGRRASGEGGGNTSLCLVWKERENRGEEEEGGGRPLACCLC